MSTRYLSSFAGLFAVISLSTVMSCGSDSNRRNNSGNGLQSTSGASGASGEEPKPEPEKSGANSDVSGSSGVEFKFDAALPEPPADVRAIVCDDSGDCGCDIRIAAIGRPASYGDGNDDTAAWQKWLESKSTAKVNLFTKRASIPEITAEVLEPYDLIVLQALEDREGASWTISQAEVDAIRTWVENGGGLITLTGYGAQTSEVDPTNKILKFADLSYNRDDIPLNGCPANLPCYCWGNSIPLASWNEEHPIAKHLTQVGVFHGHSITAGSGTEIVSKDGTVIYGATKTVGSGKVFAFADEWVLYTSQWLGAPVDKQEYHDPHNPCYGVDEDHPKTANNVFQVPQFWYNAIRYTARATECVFTIDEPDILR